MKVPVEDRLPYTLGWDFFEWLDQAFRKALPAAVEDVELLDVLPASPGISYVVLGTVPVPHPVR